MIAAVIYLAAVVAANLSIAYFGPWVAPINAFLFIGLDLSLRDRLHVQWADDQLVLKMGVLIFTGGVISYVLNRDAAQIAIASTAAFTLASLADAFVYDRMWKAKDVRMEQYPYWKRRWTDLERMNGSNLAGAAVDSFVFPLVAFGLPVLWPTVIALFAAKVGGGFVWSLILALPQRRRTA